jgi:anti-sigma regulatory factor (Ser/Thr protein kinase)
MVSEDRSEADRDAQHEAGSPAEPVEQARASAVATTLVSPMRCEGISADAMHLVGVRRGVEEWALKAGLSRETVTDVVAASYEAMANAAEHAYRERSGTIDLLATCYENDVEIIVRDQGDWRPPPADPGFRGRGLVMIRMMSHAEIEPGPDGTTVRMRWPRERDR